MTQHPRRIVVLGGGDSAERTVSLESSSAVAAALRERGHQVRLVDPTVSGLDELCPQDIDIVFPMLHGTGAEDGTLQRKLVRQQLLFVGSGVAASELTFDKVRCQRFLRRCGLPVPGSVVLNRRESLMQRLPEIGQLGLPVVVKPSRQGSSVGISMVQQLSRLADAVDSAAEWGDTVLVEAYVPGREMTVPVIDGVVFPVVEIIPSRQWYDYCAKYLDDETTYRTSPTDLPDSVTRVAQRACTVCGVSGIARVDLRLTPEGDCRILEINTIPGMTTHSLVPMSARRAGLSPGELCEQVIERRLQREVRSGRTAA